MRVLWLAGNSALYAYHTDSNGGWIAALQREMLIRGKLCLAVAFPWQSNLNEERNNVIYYGVKDIRHPIVNYQSKLQKQLSRLKDVVEDYHPDIIHVFGTEIAFGLVTTLTDVPVVVHIQGILSAIYESWLPHNLSWRDYITQNPRMYLGYDALHKSIPRERQILRQCKYFMGRTEWDKNLTQLLSPNARYFHCDEMLRPEVYSAIAWTFRQQSDLVLVSVISDAAYKGGDVILRVAYILKDITNLHFIWKVYGMSDLNFWEKFTGIKADAVNVVAMGSTDVSTLVSELQSASLFVHPSYIENSSNAICEAQCIGLPVIVTDVGGTTTLVENEKTGIVVPANDPYFMAAQIVRLANDIELCVSLGRQARVVAMKRHNPQKIVTDLVNIYNTISHA